MADTNIDYLSAVTDILKIDRILLLCAGLALMYALSKGIRVFAMRLSDKIPNHKNQILQVATLINFFVSLVGGGYVVYVSLQPPREVALALLGSATVAIGLSLKDLVSSLISGITIVADPPFRVGDQIIYKEMKGEVTHIGLRAVRILTVDQQVITIPNSNFTSDVVMAQNPGKNYVLVVVPFYMHITVNVAEVKTILREIVATSRFAYLDQKVIVQVEKTTYDNVLYLKFNVKALVNHARYGNDFQTDIYERALLVLKQHTIPVACLQENITLVRG